MKLLRNVLAGAALTAISLGLAAPAEAHSPSWGGLYAGIHGGYAWADADWTLAYPFGNPPAAATFDLDRGILGGHIGLQHQFGRVVLGAEVSFSSGLGSHAIGGLDLWAPGVGTLRTELDWLVTATARLGYAWDRWLGYVKGGYAGAMMTLEADDGVPPNFGFFNRGLHNGWTVGAGVEHQLMKGVVLGLEYNYVALDRNVTIPVVSLPATPLGVDATVDADTSLHILAARLSFKLDRPETTYEPLK